MLMLAPTSLRRVSLRRPRHVHILMKLGPRSRLGRDQPGIGAASV
jgi:hypothetical protein